MSDMTKQLDERFWSKVDRSSGLFTCWTFNGARNADDYGAFRFEGATRLAHRVSYMVLVGPIPDGLELDHLCRNHSCVNPAHLEPVTGKENVHRGLHGVLATHCPQGHAYEEADTYVHMRRRYCRICHRQTIARFRARSKARQLLKVS